MSAPIEIVTVRNRSVSFLHMLSGAGPYVCDRNTLMRPAKVLISGFVVAALVAAPLSSASASWHRHAGGGHFRGLFGVMAAIGVAALAVHAAPLAIIAGIASSGAFSGGPQPNGDEDPRGGYSDYPQRNANYGPPGEHSLQSRNYPSDGYYGGQSGYGYSQPPRGYYLPPQARNYSSSRYYGNQPQGGYDENPRGYYPQPQARNYSNSGYYGNQPQSGYDENLRGYYPSQQNQYYSRRDNSGPPQGYYGPQSRYYDFQPGY